MTTFVVGFHVYTELSRTTLPAALNDATFEEKMLWLIKFHENVLRDCGTDDITLLKKKDF